MKKSMKAILLSLCFPFVAVAASNIDYNNPSAFLKSGDQSSIGNSEFKTTIEKKLKTPKPVIADVKNAWLWKRKYFPSSAGGGANIGQMNIDQLYESKKSTGCHDDGLLMVSIIREMGVPAILVDTTGIKWSKEYAKGKKGPFEGHVFVEIFLDGHWWLVDSTTGDYIINYDPKNPIIPVNHGTQTEGYYVMVKGRDTWDYGVRKLDDLKAMQIEFAKKVDEAKIEAPKYQMGRF